MVIVSALCGVMVHGGFLLSALGSVGIPRYAIGLKVPLVLAHASRCSGFLIPSITFSFRTKGAPDLADGVAKVAAWLMCVQINSGSSEG